VTRQQNNIHNIDHKTSIWQANIPVTRWHIAIGTVFKCHHHPKTKYGGGTIACD